ncbi:MAG: AMP-binding protein [Bacteroidetes bacterium]|nr:AMP-binding protein [Bacteroidota bacterium]
MLEKIQQSYLKFPNRNAFFINGIYYSYKQFAQLISNVRNYIETNCKGSEKLIGIIAKQSPEIETYAAIYGCLFSGRGYVPINPSNPLSRNSSILEQTGIKTILCKQNEEQIKGIASTKNANVVNVVDLPSTQINLKPPIVDENEIAYLLFTSGSTGVPKGVPINRKNLNSFVDAFLELGYNVNENDRFLQMFELTFDFSVVCYTVPLCVGACIYTIPEEGVKFANVYIALEEHEITFACMVPSVLSYLTPYFDEIKLDKMRYSLFCGETLLDQIAQGWSKCTPNAKIINAYGPTEATVFCLIYEWNNESSSKKTFNGGVCIGKPMINMGSVVIDENSKIISGKPGEKGELCLSGKQLTPGYWKDDEKNVKTFFKARINGKDEIFYRTGDLAFQDDEGDFFFAGRIDNQIKIQGFRIELGEIEHFAREFIKGGNVAAVGYQNTFGNMQIHLFVENYNGNSLDIEEYLKSKIPEYMVPSYITSIPSFPLNDNGKIDRKKLVSMCMELKQSFSN